jgi:hypothetical protein
VYINHNKGVLWYTRGYIPDNEPADDDGLVHDIADQHKHVHDLVVPVAYTNAMESSGGARRVHKRHGELKP